jgi:hypothetical protein
MDSDNYENAVALITTPLETHSQDDSPFLSLHGKGSSWNVEGMDKMTTEEYYAAINQRNAEIRAFRREKGLSGPRDTDDYLKSLSRRDL